MSISTSIEWTGRTWNPLIGCSRISSGCGVADAGGCYAERFTHRFAGPGQRWEGLTRSTSNGPRWTGEVRLFEAALLAPLRWRKPSRVFVNSMSDLFHENVTDETIDRVFAVMALTPHLTHQVLTKRPERMRAYLSTLDVQERLAHAVVATAVATGRGPDAPRKHPALRFGSHGDSVLDGPFPVGFETWPLPNVHLGVSVEDQATADERIPILLQTPAAIRWVSYEPALGPVKFRPWLGGECAHEDVVVETDTNGFECRRCDDATNLDWIVVGGESGPGARPFDVAWARSTIAQCRAAGVAVFCKQIGAMPRIGVEEHRPPLQRKGQWGRPVSVTRTESYLKLRDRKGGDMSEWPLDLRVREFPEVRA